ncbi:MAG: peptide deformylase [Elusimicrobia bacterium]|nr:peptide deformylase [Elusimicrobiota bacterium]
MELRIYPDPILRKKSEKVVKDDLDKIYSEMVTAMIIFKGIGLAAPQIGLDKSIAVISEQASDDMNKPLILVNPVILERKGEQSIEESCLSVKGVSAHVPRSAVVKIETGPDEERGIIIASGLLAIVIQHEIDHLNGILFPDRLGFLKRRWALIKAGWKKKHGQKD